MNTSIPVIITQENYDMMGNKYWAYVLTNSALRASGDTPEKALRRLKHLVKSYYANQKIIGMAEINFDEELVQEVMES